MPRPVKKEEPMTVSSPRRSSRRRRTLTHPKRKVSYRERTDDEDREMMAKEQAIATGKDEDEETEEEDTTAATIRHSIKKEEEPATTKRNVATLKQEDDAHNSDSSQDTAPPPKPTPRRQSRSPAKKKTKNDSHRRKSSLVEDLHSDLLCPHCNKKFAVMYGLQYHVDNYVCRKDQKPADPKKKQPTGRSNHNTRKKRAKPESDDDQESTESDNNDSEDEKKPAAKVKSDDSEEGEDFDDGKLTSSETDDDDDHALPKKRATRAVKKDTESGPDDSKEDAGGDNLKCRHCQKKFANRRGLSYHLDKKVCQTDSSEKKPKAKSKKRPSSANTASAKKSKRFRGQKDDRTCPKCKRVFTSVLGKDYHCANRVCEQKQKGESKEMPFPTLDPGTEFITREFGVVRVIKDDRVTPTVASSLDKKAQDKYRWWKNQKSRLDGRRREQYFSSTVHSLARRKRLGQLYLEELKPKPPPHTVKRTVVEDDNRLQREIWKIYTGTTEIGSQPQEGASRIFPRIGPENPPGEHPLEPEGSHPDRIVECIQIPDRRKCIEVEGLEETESEDDEPNKKKTKRGFRQVEREVELDTTIKPMKLFLKRRLLTERYVEGGTRYRCVDCGRVFASIVGCKYHVTTYACHRPSTRSQQKSLSRKEVEEAYEQSVEVLMERQENPALSNETDPAIRHELGLVEGARCMSQSTLGQELGTHARLSSDVVGLLPPRNVRGQYSQKKSGPKRKWLPKKKREWAFYPQVWRSLGFKVVPKKPRAPGVSCFKKKKLPPLTGFPNAQLQTKIQDAHELQMKMKSLAEELVELNSESLGAYYPGVWKVLRFRKPSSKPFYVQRAKKEVDSEEEDDDDDEEMELPALRAKRPQPPPEFVPQPPPFAYGPPVIIDVSVLASEVDSGRYPSMNRNNINSEEPSRNDEEDEIPGENKHEDECYICRDSRGILYLCDFCNRVNHLLCIRTRFLVKEPEPHDDFMCNKCIQYILQRRRRAEKRRQRRNGELPPSANATTTSASANDNTEEKAPEASEAACSESLPVTEFDILAKKNQSVDQIVELLKDAQARLQLLVETSKINDFRRSQFDA
ncbi:expressed unknown protein [Seminavis robusta]|uniref:Uncharacterized protein n=1 Tax=Seminavis robusta TaxID=568900 RepID=A0A9N8ETA4_9STRA|nr:expressed unknown protein [Seminavis robusta]|eukprot:Sro1567_g282960.1 n/a (1081) ;mRNA; f:5680-9121